MSLPSIIDIADKAELVCNERTRSRREVYYKCPFCNGDGHKHGKYKLSLNQEENIFRCWLCGQKGGVFVFESLVTGIPYDEIKKKYSKRRNFHPAELLSPKQLRLISWEEAKRKNRESFKTSLDSVLKDWKAYEREQLIYQYAKFTVITGLTEIDPSLAEALTVGLMKSCEETGIKNLFSRLVDEYTKEQKTEWVESALVLARNAWKASLRSGDTSHEQTMANLAYLWHVADFKKSCIANQNTDNSGKQYA